MPTIQYLTGTDREQLKQSIVPTYLHYNLEFALALHEGLALPMRGLLKDGVIVHVLIAQPNTSQLRDVRGNNLVNESELGEPFRVTPPYTFINISPEDLSKIRPLEKTHVQKARALAEALWSNLAWEEKHQHRFEDFMRRLEALSLETGIWIRNPHPLSTTVLFENEDQNPDRPPTTYKMVQTTDGLSFCFTA